MIRNVQIKSNMLAEFSMHEGWLLLHSQRGELSGAGPYDASVLRKQCRGALGDAHTGSDARSMPNTAVIFIPGFPLAFLFPLWFS